MEIVCYLTRGFFTFICFSGFKFHLCSPFNALQGLLHKAESQDNSSLNTSVGSANSDATESEESSGIGSVSDEIGDSMASGASV